MFYLHAAATPRRARQPRADPHSELWGIFMCAAHEGVHVCAAWAGEPRMQVVQHRHRRRILYHWAAVVSLLLINISFLIKNLLYLCVCVCVCVVISVLHLNGNVF